MLLFALHPIDFSDVSILITLMQSITLEPIALAALKVSIVELVHAL